MKLTLPLAASTGTETDYLLLGLVGVSVAVLALVFGLMLLYVVRYRHDSPIDRGAIAEKSFRFESTWTIATLLLFFGLFIWGSVIYVRALSAARERAENLRHCQTVDVEDRARRRPAGDQRVACPDRYARSS